MPSRSRTSAWPSRPRPGSGRTCGVFDPAAAADAVFALRIDGDWFGVTVAGGSIDIAHGRSARPAVTLETDAATLRSAAFGREPIAAAELDGRLTLLGSRPLAERFARMFRVPSEQTAE
jgi:SCP-2 sterol transfer family